MAHTNRIRKQFPVAPTQAEIDAECELIRSQWSTEIKHQRNLKRRLDTSDHQFQAHLRFLAFLAQYESKES